MPRYIDADKLWNDRPIIPEGKSQDYGAGFSECMWGFSKRIREQIDNPTADVVPKSEVARLEQEIETLKDNNEHLAVMLMEAKAEVAREIFDKIRKRAYSERGFFVVNSDIDDFIAELKKKYTENENG